MIRRRGSGFRVRICERGNTRSALKRWTRSRAAPLLDRRHTGIRIRSLSPQLFLLYFSPASRSLCFIAPKTRFRSVFRLLSLNLHKIAIEPNFQTVFRSHSVVRFSKGQLRACELG